MIDLLSWVPILLEEDRVCRRDLDTGAGVRVTEDREELEQHRAEL